MLPGHGNNGKQVEKTKTPSERERLDDVHRSRRASILCPSFDNTGIQHKRHFDASSRSCSEQDSTIVMGRAMDPTMLDEDTHPCKAVEINPGMVFVKQRRAVPSRPLHQFMRASGMVVQEWGQVINLVMVTWGDKMGCISLLKMGDCLHPRRSRLCLLLSSRLNSRHLCFTVLAKQHLLSRTHNFTCWFSIRTSVKELLTNLAPKFYRYRQCSSTSRA